MEQAGARGRAAHLRRARSRGRRANFATLQNLDLDAGRYFTERENEHAAPVAVIGSEVRDELFPHVDPIGPHRLDRRLRRTASSGYMVKQGSVLGHNPDLQVYVPYRTAQKLVGRGRAGSATGR